MDLVCCFDNFIPAILMKPRPLRFSKICPVCKRSFENRKKWESRGIWDQIVYCSDKCRKESRRKQSG
ncbi:MAG: DUF2256 domain-containing protein [Opitutales bacterium]